MKGFKEWLSDYLRYFMLILAAVLLFAIIFIGVKVYQNYDSPTAGENIEILTEAKRATEKMTESGTSKENESETEEQAKTETESSTEELSEKESGTDEAPGAASLPSETQRQASAVTQNQTTAGTDTAAQGQNGQSTEASQGQALAETVQSETQAETQPQTEPQTETEPEPVYRTMTGACNFRSGPGYEYEVMAEYPAGTVVEFLGIVEGWCEVRIDGVIGYMGQRFFE